MVLKRATAQLKEAGINLEVHKGMYGPYLYDRSLKHQTSKVHKTTEDCVKAAIEGERPAAVEKSK